MKEERVPQRKAEWLGYKHVTPPPCHCVSLAFGVEKRTAREQGWARWRPPTRAPFSLFFFHLSPFFACRLPRMNTKARRKGHPLWKDQRAMACAIGDGKGRRCRREGAASEAEEERKTKERAERQSRQKRGKENERKVTSHASLSLSPYISFSFTYFSPYSFV